MQNKGPCAQGAQSLAKDNETKIGHFCWGLKGLLKEFSPYCPTGVSHMKGRIGGVLLSHSVSDIEA